MKRAWEVEWAPAKETARKEEKGENAKDHGEGKKTKKPTCPFAKCTYIFPTTVHLKSHVYYEHLKLGRRCPQRGCRYRSYHRGMLERHQQRSHEHDSQAGGLCRWCSSEFDDPFQFDLHLLQSHPQHHVVCKVSPDCRRSCARADEYIAHVQHDHQSDVCSKRYKPICVLCRVDCIVGTIKLALHYK